MELRVSITEVSIAATILVVIAVVAIGIARVVFGPDRAGDTKRCRYCNKWILKTSVFCPLCGWPRKDLVDEVSRLGG
jgi:hypothetical protein